jgi:hypothetical protein
VANRDHSCSPAAHKVATPMVALTIVHRQAPAMMTASTSGTRRRPSSKEGRPAEHPGGEHGFEVVARGEHERGPERGHRCRRWRERQPAQTAGQKAESTEKQRRECDAGRRPDVVICSATKATRNPSSAAAT